MILVLAVYLNTTIVQISESSMSPLLDSQLVLLAPLKIAYENTLVPAALHIKMLSLA